MPSMRLSSDLAMRIFVIRLRTLLLPQFVQVTAFFPYSL